MLDIQYIRENVEKVKQSCKNKGVDVNIDRVLELDKERRQTFKELESVRHKRNLLTKKIAKQKYEIN